MMEWKCRSCHRHLQDAPAPTKWIRSGGVESGGSKPRGKLSQSRLRALPLHAPDGELRPDGVREDAPGRRRRESYTAALPPRHRTRCFPQNPKGWRAAEQGTKSASDVYFSRPEGQKVFIHGVDAKIVVLQTLPPAFHQALLWQAAGAGSTRGRRESPRWPYVGWGAAKNRRPYPSRGPAETSGRSAGPSTRRERRFEWCRKG